MSKPTTYEIRLRGSIGARTAAVFEPMDSTTETVLRGSLVDQAALHGVLDRIRDLGLELIDVRQIVEE